MTTERNRSEDAQDRATPNFIRGRHATLVGLAGIFSAAVAYVVLLIAAQILSAPLNAEFLVFWAILFGSFGVVSGITPEASRAAYDGDHRPTRTPTLRGASIVSTALVFGAVAAALVAVSSLVWGRVALPNHSGLVLVAASACWAFSGHLALWGILNGLGRWVGSAALLIGESSVRLVAVLVVVATDGSLVALAVASSVSAAAWLGALLWPSVRRQLTRRADVGPGRLLRNYLTASAATAASAALIVGLPFLISLTATSQELLGAAGLMLAVSLTRAPLLVPLMAYQGVALSYFLRHRSRGVLALLPMLAVIAAVTAAASGLAFVIGPWLYSFVLGGRYSVSGALLAGLVAAAGVLAMLTLAGICALAVRRHLVFAAGWVVATLLALGILLAPWALPTRVLVALLVGPGLGLLVQLIGLRGAATTAAD